MQIAAIIIARNEAANIARCVASLQGVADEIWVLNNHSTDDTAAIARAAGATVVDVEWQGYARTKNAGHTLTQLPYLLSLDADELLSPGLREEILAAKPQLSGEAWSMPRLSWYCGRWIRHCGWYPDRKIRLFPKGAAWQGDFVHETLVLPPNTPVRAFRSDLQHYTYMDTSSHIAKTNHYSTLAAAEMHNRGKKATLVKLVLAPAFKFFQMYVLRLGWLDGWQGWQLCKISAMGVMLKYAKLKELNNN